MVTYGPYSPVRQAGDTYYISGQIGVDPRTKTAGPGVQEQTHQVLRNLHQLLTEADLSFADIVKTTVFLKNMDDFQLVNEIYMQYFPEPRPARSCVEISRLPTVAGDTQLLVEIEAVAYKKQQKGQA